MEEKGPEVLFGFPTKREGSKVSRNAVGTLELNCRLFQ